MAFSPTPNRPAHHVVLGRIRCTYAAPHTAPHLSFAASSSPRRTSPGIACCRLGPAKRDAFCSILRYDYSCFGYKPARVCAGASAEAMRAECPLVELQGKLVAPNGYTDVNPLNGRTDA